MSARRRRVTKHVSEHHSTCPSSSSSAEYESTQSGAPSWQFRAPPRLRRPSRLPTAMLVVTISMIGALLHCGHLASMHESHLSFAYLSNTERELTFRTEMGFYYSFFKQIILANTFYDGIVELFNDTVTEFPSVFDKIDFWDNSSWGYLPAVPSTAFSGGIHVLKRFNIYPEVVLGALYRTMAYFDLLESECFQVSIEGARQNYATAVSANQINDNTSFRLPLEPIGTLTGNNVFSCDGSREPPMFYVNCVFCLAGLTTWGLALSGWQVASCGAGSLSWAAKSVALWGAVLPLVGFFFNHGEATRVQWSPPLRESFAFPFFILQQTVIIWLLKEVSPGRCRLRQPGGALLTLVYVIYTLLCLAFQLPWQFAQFVLLTQLVSLIAAYVFTYLTCGLSATSRPKLFAVLATRLGDLLTCQLMALGISWLLQLGNQLLLTSAYLPLLIGCLVGLLCHRGLLNRSKMASGGGVSRRSDILQVILVLGLTQFTAIFVAFILRHLFPGGVLDGSHITDLLKVKLFNATDSRTFHTQLYTCAAEFDFLPLSTLLELTRTGLLPGALLAVLVALVGIAWRPPSTSSTATTTMDPFAQPHACSTTATTTTERCVFTSSRSLSIQQQILLHKESHLLTADLISNFVIAQLGVFGLLAGLVMRLKLFFTPQLCLSLAILTQPRLFFGSHKIPLLLLNRWRGGARPTHPPEEEEEETRNRRAGRGAQHHKSAFLSVVSWRRLILVHSFFIGGIAISSYQGVRNLQMQWSKQGQFSDFVGETMLQWASKLPSRTDGKPWVFTGAMPTMATIRLGLVVPGLPGKYAITNHPHYEDVGIRLRTELAYAACSRKPPKAVWNIYRRILKADFVVIERGWCLSEGARRGCSSVELWDLLDPGLVAPALCWASFNERTLGDVLSPYFTPVFLAVDQSLVVWRVEPLLSSV